VIAQTGGGSLSATGHVFVVIVTVLTLLFVWRMLRRHQIRSKYALVWTGAALVLGVLAVVPGLLVRITSWVGIDYAPALFLLLAVGFLFLVVVEFSRELSRLDNRTRILAEELAFLRAVRDAPTDARAVDEGEGEVGRADAGRTSQYDPPSGAAPEKATD
jgi:hypothetical protein